MFRLKELRKENGLKRSEFAKALNIPATTIANYENETREASYETLIVFSEFFNVSIDYLLGKTSDYVAAKPNITSDKLLTQNEKELLREFRTCSSTGKNRIMEYAKLWSKSENI